MLGFALVVDGVGVVGVSGSQDWGNCELVVVNDVYYGICSRTNSDGVAGVKVDGRDGVELVGAGGVEPDVGRAGGGG